ncbi:retropepsin-like aspartic protease [Xanthocytophaga agilis]|uniref:Retropepsin-like aspartic protease n=1 Tax=Xanthocytophaga agilis TaxID=3048010 RepID=A0AAE3RCW3_9BACT|nr:retropepsin-like aspartic protease [Xanthocytophaga agilis]MDJ1505343.1 retropepsin-like aspartic protease [Xanthocytophaga agilis]
MKKSIILLLYFFTIITCQAQSSNAFVRTNNLLAQKDFFAARDLYHSKKSSLSEVNRLITEANIDHIFNRLKSSNQKIELLFQKYNHSMSDSVKYKLYSIRQINHGKLYEYKEAFAVIDQLLNSYSQFMTNEEKQDFANTRLIWKALSGQPKQQIRITEETALKIKRDKAGLATIRVTHGKDSSAFIFDTGANLSTVTESMAKKFGMQFLEGVIDVTAITGNTVKSHIAVCPEINLGHIQVRNAVFLVFPDSALAVPAIQYQMHGIIGFPVIEALREIQITKSEELIVPLKSTIYASQNMALDFLTPIIELNGDSYTFDTGANTTILYRTYFLKHQKDIEQNYKIQELQFGGAGGTIRKQGYQITFSPTINNKVLRMDSVQVYTDVIKADEGHLSGNIGQDLIRRFDKMIISFASMSIQFK